MNANINSLLAENCYAPVLQRNQPFCLKTAQSAGNYFAPCPDAGGDLIVGHQEFK